MVKGCQLIILLCGNVRKKAAEGPAFFDCKWCSDARLDSLTDGRTRRKTDTDAHRRHTHGGAASQYISQSDRHRQKDRQRGLIDTDRQTD